MAEDFYSSCPQVDDLKDSNSITKQLLSLPAVAQATWKTSQSLQCVAG